MAGSSGNGTPPFTRPRVIGALLLLGTACVLAIFDAIPAFDYTLDNVTFLLMLGTGSVLLGVEAFRKFVG